MRKTVLWDLEHLPWCTSITSGVYRRERLGLGLAGASGGAQ
jgi:hypothetical protein